MKTQYDRQIMNWEVNSTMDFNIKKGDRYLCTQTVWLYIQGKVYECEKAGCLTDESGNKDHVWEVYAGDTSLWPEHFVKITGDLPSGKDYFQSMIEEYGSNMQGALDKKLSDKRTFDSGAVRDSNKDKPFIHCLLGYTRQRFGYHMAKNATKYGENNFMRGIPTKVYLESLDRHLAAYMEDDRSEDHISAILFAVNGIMLNEKNDGIPANHYFK